MVSGWRSIFSQASFLSVAVSLALSLLASEAEGAVTYYWRLNRGGGGSGTLGSGGLAEHHQTPGSTAGYSEQVTFAADANGNLGALAYAEFRAPYLGAGQLQSEVTLRWNDQLRLTSDAGAAVSPSSLPGDYLVLEFALTSAVRADIYEDATTTAYFRALATGAGVSAYAQSSIDRGGVQHGTYEGIGFFSNERVRSNVYTGDTFFLRVPLTGPAAGIFFYELSVSAYANYGIAEADALHTLSLSSVTFANGVTPESLGYQVQFNSGMESPNLAAVPEPSSIIAFGIGSLLLGFQQRRRLMMGTSNTV